MARLGGHERHGNRLGVAHLSDKNDVGILPEHFSQSLLERFQVPSDLALRDHRLLLRKDVLDRIFGGHDPAGFHFADSVDQRGDRRGFARAGDAGHENQTVFEIDDILPDVVGKADVLQLRNIHRQRSNRPGQAVVLREDVDAKLQITDPVGAIHAALGTEFSPLIVAHQRIEKLPGHLGIYVRAFELDQIPVDAIGGRRADLDMQVRDPHRPVFLEVIQHIQNAEFTHLFGRIHLRRSRIVFCHRHLQWC